jgi:hypothetical protein
MADVQISEAPATTSPTITIEPPPEEPGIPLLSGLSRLLRSSKAIVVCVAIIAIGVLCYLGKLTPELSVDTVKWLIVAFVGAVAIEDGATKITAKSGTSATRAAWLMQQLLPVVLGLIEGAKRPASGATLSPEADAMLKEAQALYDKNQAAAASAAAAKKE